MDALYEEEDEILDWQEVIDQYQLVMTSNGLRLKRKEGFR